LGLLYKQEGDKDAARKYLEKALKMVDSDSSVNNREQLKQHIKQEGTEWAETLGIVLTNENKCPESMLNP
jgi:hypothetical protein